MKDNDFIQRIEAHRHEFYAYLHRQLWDKNLVDDVFSQAMLTVWEKRDQFMEGTNFRAWIYKIPTFKSFSSNKRTSRNVIRLEDIGENFEPEDDRPQDGSLHWHEGCDEALPQAPKRLSEKKRACLLMRSLKGLSYKEIADSVGIPMGMVMTHLHRARKKLKRELAPLAKERGWDSTTSKKEDQA